MSSNCYYCGGHPDEIADSRRRRDELEAENAALRLQLVKCRAALTLAEDILSRRPFSSDIWPNGMHPQTGIEQIRSALTDDCSETGK